MNFCIANICKPPSASILRLSWVCKLGVFLQNIVKYYFGRTYIAPQDVSQQLFKVNLTAIASNLTDPDVASLVAATQTAGGQAVVSRASTADQANINALQSRISSLTGNITTLDTQIQVSFTSPLICLSCKRIWKSPNHCEEDRSAQMRLYSDFDRLSKQGPLFGRQNNAEFCSVNQPVMDFKMSSSGLREACTEVMQQIFQYKTKRRNPS